MSRAGEGGFALIVGPSGAGKDTLIGLARTTLAGDPRFLFPKRLVTRPRSAFEDHDTIDEAAFARGQAEERFALSWRAHGLGYAVPGEVLTAVRPDRIAVCNVSRRVVDDARRHLANVAVVEITAPVEMLAQRLAARSRGEDGDLDARLTRSQAIGETRADLTIINDRSPEEGAANLVAFLKGHAAREASPRGRREGFIPLAGDEASGPRT